AGGAAGAAGGREARAGRRAGTSARSSGCGGPSPGAGAAVAGRGSRTGADGARRIFASPLARRLAKARGLDLATLSGSGPHGRIVKRDVEAAPARQGSEPQAATAVAARGAGPPVVPPPMPA